MQSIEECFGSAQILAIINNSGTQEWQADLQQW